MSHAKRKGWQREDKTRDILTKRDYLVVRAAGSLGPFDMIAISLYDIRLIQVKSNRWPGPKERKEMEKYRDKVPENISFLEEWRWDDYARKPKIRIYDGKKWKEEE